jgi:peptide/histidine transporter 3/4
MEKGDGEYAQDGSVDLRGNPVLRSKRGGWTACTFIVGTYVRRPAGTRAA